MAETVQELIDKLKAELDGANPDHEEVARLKAELDRRSHEGDHSGLVEDLRERVLKLEASHPQLAEVIGRTADALSAIGL
jgi:hypothetical protein